MLPEQIIKVDANLDLTKRSMGPNGTAYIGTIDQDVSAMVNSTVTKKGQRRTLLRCNVSQEVVTTAGSTTYIYSGVQVVISTMKESDPLKVAQALKGALAMANDADLVARLIRGEQ